jgi:hypothetical protein
VSAFEISGAYRRLGWIGAGVLVLAAAGMLAPVMGLIGSITPTVDPLWPMLRSVEEAPEQVDYQGRIVLTSFYRETFETRVAINHRAGGRDQYRLEGWRRGEGEWTAPTDPTREFRFPQRRRISRPVLDSQLAARNYRLEEMAGESVAGRPAYVLEMRPHQAGRPSYRLWIDQSLGLALGLETRDGAGKPIARWMFESLELGAADWGEAGAGPRSAPLSLEELLERRPFSLWLPQRLPSGYAFHRARVHGPAGRGGVTVGYTDGMNVISIIQRNQEGAGWKLQEARSADGKPLVHRWSSNGISVLNVRLGQAFVTVVGHEEAGVLTDMVRSMMEHP